MRKTPTSFTSIFLSMLLIIGAIPTLTSIPLIDTEAFAEKNGLDLDLEHDHEKNYQQMYKQADFEKYLNDQYEIHKEYTQYYGDLLYSVENPQANPFFSDEIVREPIDEDNKESNTKDDEKDDYEKDDSNDNYDEDDNGKSLTSESNRKDSDTTDNLYSSDKIEKKTYKNIKIIRCLNHNINAYDVEDFSDVVKFIKTKEAEDSRDLKKILNEATFSENKNDDDINHEESEIKNNKEAQEYNIGSETKIIFICKSDNLNIQPTKIIRSLPNEGIMLPVT